MGYGENVGTLYFDKGAFRVPYYLNWRSGCCCYSLGRRGIIYYIKLCLYNNFISNFQSKPGEMKVRREKKFQDSIFFFEKGHEKVVHFYF